MTIKIYRYLKLGLLLRGDALPGVEHGMEGQCDQLIVRVVVILRIINLHIHRVDHVPMLLHQLVKGVLVQRAARDRVSRGEVGQNLEGV